MGVSDTRQLEPSDLIARNHFDFQCVIGRGGFGKVWKVVYKKTRVAYAVKELSKVKVIDKKSERSIKMEKEILSLLPKHQFIVNMLFFFQDRDYIYFLLDLLSGGDLRYHLGLKKRLTEEQTKFTIACVILGLEHIHKNEILHRDIKPENLVCDENGYIRITDFGVAKKYVKYNYKDTSGTLGYMAPEVLSGENHSYSVDYFALGVIGYEFMLGTRPYKGKTRNEMRHDMITHQPCISEDNLPCSWSIEAMGFINRLIQRKPKQRFESLEEMKGHYWFNNFDWNDLANQKMTSPFKIKKRDYFDKVSIGDEKPISPETIERYNKIKEDPSYDKLFNDVSSNVIPEELRYNNYCNNKSNCNNNSNNGFNKDTRIKEWIKSVVKPKKDSSLNLDISNNRNPKLVLKKKYKMSSSSIDFYHKTTSQMPSIRIEVKDKRPHNNKNSKSKGSLSIFNQLIPDYKLNPYHINNDNNQQQHFESSDIVFGTNIMNMWRLGSKKNIIKRKLFSNSSMSMDKDLPLLLVKNENDNNYKQTKNKSKSKGKSNVSLGRDNNSGSMKFIQKPLKHNRKSFNSKLAMNQTSYDNTSLFGCGIKNKVLNLSMSNNNNKSNNK